MIKIDEEERSDRIQNILKDLDDTFSANLPDQGSTFSDLYSVEVSSLLDGDSLPTLFSHISFLSEMVPLLEEEEVDFSNTNQDTGDSEEEFGLSKEAVSACQGEIQIMDIQSSQMAISITGLVLPSSFMDDSLS